MNDLEGLLDDTDRQLLLTVVSSLHHHRVHESLDNWACGLSESLLLITTSSVGEVNSRRVLEGDVILKNGDNQDKPIRIRTFKDKSEQLTSSYVHLPKSFGSIMSIVMTNNLVGEMFPNSKDDRSI